MSLIYIYLSTYFLSFLKTGFSACSFAQAAFECMYTLLDSCLDRLDVFEFLQHVEDGLKDHYDIKMLTYLMLVRLAHLCPSAVLQRKCMCLRAHACVCFGDGLNLLNMCVMCALLSIQHCQCLAKSKLLPKSANIQI